MIQFDVLPRINEKIVIGGDKGPFENPRCT